MPRMPKETVIGEAFGLACGILGWEPGQFWRATPLELASALEAYCRFHGLRRGGVFGAKDAADLRALLDEQVKKENTEPVRGGHVS